MQWFPDLANVAFCETVELRKKISQRQLPRSSSLHRTLEPSSAEFIAALAAGIDSQRILQVGCGMSTIALAVAAQATGGFLVSIHTDKNKQDIVRHHMKYLGLITYVEFIVSEPYNVCLTRKSIDFAHFTGDPKDYINLFDHLNLNNGAIVVADNALCEASNEYIQHVQRQPGMDSSTLPFARGMEVTKMASPEKFKSGRIFYSGSKSVKNGVRSVSPVHEETKLPTYSDSDEYDGMEAASDQTVIGLNKQTPSDISGPVMLDTITTPIASKIERDISRPNIEEPLDSSVEASCLVGSNNEVSAGTDNAHTFSFSGKVNDESCFQKSDVNSVFKVYFQNHDTETEVSITGVNQDMLLSDITTALSDMGISVKMASISTQGNLIEDVFFVTNSNSGTPLLSSQWNAVRERILQRIGLRWGREQETHGAQA